MAVGKWCSHTRTDLRSTRIGGRSRNERVNDGQSWQNQKRRENETRNVGRSSTCFNPLKIHPGILLATDLNNVVGEEKGVRRESCYQLFASLSSRESWKSKSWKPRERKRLEAVEEGKRAETRFRDSWSFPHGTLKSLRAIWKAQHRSYEAVLGPSTPRYLEDTRFNSEPRFTATITRVEREQCLITF